MTTIAIAKRPPHLRRNFLLFLADIILFGTAIGFIGASTVIPDFVSRLTTSKELIGLSGSLYNFAWLMPQLALAQIVNRGTRRKPFMLPVVPFRTTMGIMAILIALVSANNPTLILAIFFCGYTVFATTDGMISLAWADMLGGSIPTQSRSTLFAVGQVLQTAVAFGTREIVRIVLAPGGPSFPQNYALLFLIAEGLFLAGGICLSFTIEEKTEVPLDPGPPLREYLPYVGNVLRTDKEFRRFSLTRIVLDMAMMALPFYVIFGADVLKLNRDTLVADSILLSTIGSAIASLMMGWFSRRSGSRAVIQVAATAKILLPGLALLSIPFGQPALYASFIMLGFITASIAPGYFDWVITHAPPARRPIYVGLSNTISAISNLAPLLGGIILSLTSYAVLFGLSVVIAVGGLGLSLTMSEPRHRLTATINATAEIG